MRIKYFYALLFLGLSTLIANAQTITVSGIVKSSNNETIPGATVVEKGTKNVAVTNFDGKFTLAVKQGSTLVVSSIGMKTREIVASATMIIVLEESAEQLKEVQVTALGIEREKKALGYAVEEIGGAAISKSGEANMVTGLASKAAGIQVTNSSGASGAASYIKIRGNASFTQNDNQPLFVVDGVPINNSQNLTEDLRSGVSLSNRAIDINPDDIENVTVLKGGAAASLYGTRGANGVILITTKKGGFNQPFKVDVSSSIEMMNVNKLPATQEEYAQGIFGGLRQFGQPLGQFSWGPRISNLGYDPNGRLTDVDSLMAPGTRGTAPSFNNTENFFRTGIRTNNNISLSGGSTNTSYLLSIGNLYESGIVPINDFQRTSVRLSGTGRVSRTLKTSASINYVNSGGTRIQQGSNTSGLMLGLLRTPPSFDNSNGVKDASDESAFLNANGSQRQYAINYDNPYWTINRNPFNDKVNRIQGNVQVDYVPVEWLKILYRLGTDVYTDRRTQIIARQSRTQPNGRIIEDIYTWQEWNSDLIVTANKKFGKFDAQVLAGWNVNQRTLDNVYVQGDGFALENFYNLSNASNIIATQDLDRRRLAGLFGEALLSYDDQFFVTLTARGDRASTFGNVGTTIFYPSASFSWLFSETFKLSNDVFSSGKLRASIARVGLEPAFGSNRTYFNRTSVLSGWIDGIEFPFNNTTGFSQSNVLGNPNLEPEYTSTTEIGFDLGFLKNRIGLEFTYYNQQSTNLIVAVPVAGSTGFTQSFQNIGQMENRGIEINVNALIIDNKDFKWNLGFNFTRNRNKVISLAPGVDVIDLPWGFFGANQRLLVGEAYGTLYGDDWERDANGNALVDEFGYPVYSPVEVKVGDPNPNFLMGIINNFTYKNWSLDMVWDIRNGGDIWNGTRGALDYFGTSAATGGVRTAYGDPNDDNGRFVFFDVVAGNNGVYAPGTIINGVDVSGQPNQTRVANNEESYALGPLSGFTGASRPYIEDGSWVRLRQLTLSYTLPKKVFENSKFLKGLTFNLTGRNLLLFTDYTGIDPETNLSGATNSQGADYFNMPATRGIIFGLNANFF